MRVPDQKVLLLIKSLGLGGAERLLVDSLPYLDRARSDYRLACVSPWAQASVSEHFDMEGIARHCETFRRQKRAEKDAPG